MLNTYIVLQFNLGTVTLPASQCFTKGKTISIWYTVICLQCRYNKSDSDKNLDFVLFLLLYNFKSVNHLMHNRWCHWRCVKCSICVYTTPNLFWFLHFLGVCVKIITDWLLFENWGGGCSLVKNIPGIVWTVSSFRDKDPDCSAQARITTLRTRFSHFHGSDPDGGNGLVGMVVTTFCRYSRDSWHCDDFRRIRAILLSVRRTVPIPHEFWALRVLIQVIELKWLSEAALGLPRPGATSIRGVCMHQGSAVLWMGFHPNDGSSAALTSRLLS